MNFREFFEKFCMYYVPLSFRIVKFILLQVFSKPYFRHLFCNKTRKFEDQTCRGLATPPAPFRNAKWTKDFVDKTGFIEQFFKFPSKYVYITAPPQFGKTITLDMLAEFCGAHVTKNGTVLKPNATDVYTVFARTTIIQKRRFLEAHMQNYMVIYLDFWRLLYTKNYQTFQNGLCYTLCRMMTSFKFLQNVKTKFDWTPYVNEDSCRHYCLNSRISLSVARDLSEELHLLFRKPVILLVDELDAILHDIIVMRESIPYSQQILSDLAGFLGTLMRDEAVDRALLFGSVSLGDSLLAISDNIEHISYNNLPDFAQYLGFSRQDVELLLGKFGRGDKFEEVTYWYGGYSVKGQTDLILFRPFSVRNFVWFGKFANYWPRISPNLSPHFYTYFAIREIRSCVEQVLSEDSPFFNFSRRGLNFQRIELMNERITNATSRENYECLDRKEVSIFMQYLTEIGLFSVISKSGQVENIQLRLTNHETTMEVKWYMSRHTVDK